MTKIDDNVLASHALCWGCVGEEYLSNQIRKEGKRRLCHYCGKRRASFVIAEVADIVEVAFESHFERTASEPDSYEYAAMNDPESTYEWYREGNSTSEAIMYAADMPSEAADDIQSILSDRHFDFDASAMGEETPFGDDVHYEEIMPGDAEWREGWDSFERSLKTEARFFSRTAASQLAALFGEVETMRTRLGAPLIVDAGPETAFTHLYRARVFQSREKLNIAMEHPDKDLGAPPSNLAASGRMNAKGISTFYGATSEDVALAEVRPPVGSDVAIARFEIVRPLRLLDLNALADVHEEGSIFDPGYAARLGRMMFLRGLRDRMSRPVMPDDQEIEYLPTQAVADYLATEAKAPLDGIVFPSVQAGSEGVNVVLFHKASRCEERELPEGTKVTTYMTYSEDENSEPDITVFEEVPPPSPEEPAAPKAGPFAAFRPFDWDKASDGDYRNPALRVDLENIAVHHVTSVSFGTSVRPVRRHRSVRGEDPF